MKLIVDTEAKTLTEEDNGKVRHFDLYSKEAFERLSRQWVKVGWNQKYPYTFSWMGRPIIQLPEDMMRIQEVIYNVKPDVIIETGVAHGGSLIFYASLCKAMGKGRVIGIDVEIRPHNRKAIENHELSKFITLLEGDSVSGEIVGKAKPFVSSKEAVLVILDSCHSKAHVLKELEAYSGLVTSGSYIVATDGIMYDLYDVPRGRAEWETDNPLEAVKDFIKVHSEFVQEQPRWSFNESALSENITHWPCAWLRRR